MKNFSKFLLVFSFVLGVVGSTMAATTPSLGVTATFGILSSTYTNTTPGTVINGDVGYTTPPVVVPTVNGITHMADGSYNQAGIDQGALLSALAAQPCTFTFANGAIDLASDTTHGVIGVYEPGVYCTSAPGAASIGTAGITLSGAGTYIFRINGALTSVANSQVTVSNNASACDVFWTPTAATTLGANTTFLGILIDPAGITIGANSTWMGLALSFGGTVTTDMDTISVPSCILAPVVIVPPVVPVVPIIETGIIEPIVAPVVIPPVTPPLAPGFPTTGIAPQESTSLGGIALFAALFIIASGLLFLVLRKRTV